MRPLVMVLIAAVTSGCAFFWDSPGTPLAKAAHQGDIVQIKALVAAGADPNEYDPAGQTALHWAARGGHPVGPHRCHGETAERADVIAVLLDLGANVNAIDHRDRIPGGSSGWTPLHVALHHEQFGTAARLLARGADPNIRTNQGVSVMAMASDEGAPVELLKEIIAKGFDPQKADGR